MTRDKLETRIQRLENSLKASEVTEPPTYFLMQDILDEGGYAAEKLLALADEPDVYAALYRLANTDESFTDAILRAAEKQRERDEK